MRWRGGSGGSGGSERRVAWRLTARRQRRAQWQSAGVGGGGDVGSARWQWSRRGRGSAVHAMRVGSLRFVLSKVSAGMVGAPPPPPPPATCPRGASAHHRTRAHHRTHACTRARIRRIRRVRATCSARPTCWACRARTTHQMHTSLCMLPHVHLIRLLALGQGLGCTTAAGAPQAGARGLFAGLWVASMAPAADPAHTPPSAVLRSIQPAPREGLPVLPRELCPVQACAASSSCCRPS